MNTEALAGFRRQLMWGRLISVVEELAQTLIRTAFSASTREAGDLSAGIFTPDGRMIAQAITGTPGHVNSMAMAVKHFLAEFPAADMRPGDAFMTNDPWKGSGHLNDLTLVTPALVDGRLVALFAATVHVVDIGGLGVGIEARDVHQEGLYIPIMALSRGGVLDQSLLKIIRANVREPTQVEGDVHSLIAGNEAGIRRLSAMLREFDLVDLESLAEFIFEASRRGMINAVAELPAGVYRNRMVTDGLDRPIELVASLTIGESGILIDYDGTSGMSEFGINVPKTYADAYTMFGVRCLVGPKIPNNAGSLSVVEVRAPEGCILNPPYPAPVSARAMIGQMLPDVILGCLHEAVPHRTPAEGTSCLWNIRVAGGWGVPGIEPNQLAGRSRFNITTFNAGGAGARPGKDGLTATSFPAGVRTVPLEIIEAMTPLIFWRKEIREGSGGHGKWRGGDGQTIELAHADGDPFALNATFDRAVNPPRGRSGGQDGKPGVVRLASGTVMKTKGRQSVPAGERLVVEMPGGGGLGNPSERDPDLVGSDVEDGRIDARTAAAVYGFKPAT
jgi:N-methylhydantoinase B